MNLIEKILNRLPKEPIAVRKVVIGVHWTLVASKYGGLASTMMGQKPHGESRVRDVGHLHERSAQELAAWALSDNLLEASIGMAAINSLLELDNPSLEEVNASEVITRLSKDKNLVVVGHFPFVERIKRIPKNCWVIEQQPQGDDFKEEDAKIYIPRADVVAITASAFINHTIEGLIDLCQPESTVMVLGPSTPMAPQLFNEGISFLSGSRVYDEEDAVATIQQGATFQQVKGVRRLTLSKIIPQ